jgi:hypothetical protein
MTSVGSDAEGAAGPNFSGQLKKLRPAVSQTGDWRSYGGRRSVRGMGLSNAALFFFEAAAS